MIRAKCDQLSVGLKFVWIDFDAIDEPVYPLIGDKYRLYSDSGSLEYDAEVIMVNFTKDIVYLKIYMDNPIDTSK